MQVLRRVVVHTPPCTLLTKQVMNCLCFFSISLAPSMMMQRISSHHIKNSSLWKFVSRFCKGVTFPNELKDCFCYLLLLKKAASYWVCESKFMMCVRVCVLYMCKNCLVAFRARHAAADSLPRLFWKKKERILPSVIPVYFCHLFQTTNIDQQLLCHV